MRFEVLEYLKGSGSPTIVVESPDRRNTYLTESEALSTARQVVESRDATMDGSQVVVFLEKDLPEDSSRPIRASSDSGNRFESRGVHTKASSGTGDDDPQILGYSNSPWIEELSYEISEVAPFSLAELRSRIEATDALMKAGEGIEGYRRCIAQKLVKEIRLRDWEAYYGEPYSPNTIRKTTPSGQPEGFEFHTRWESPGGNRHWLTGPDSELVQVQTLGDGTTLSFRIARPLPGGVYEFTENYQFSTWMPCNYTSAEDQYPVWEVTVVPPRGTVHEAFFDPVESGRAIGASRSVGVLKPRDFDVAGQSQGLPGWNGQPGP